MPSSVKAYEYASNPTVYTAVVMQPAHTSIVYLVYRVDCPPPLDCLRASFTGYLPSRDSPLEEDTPTTSKAESITGMMSSLP